MGGIRSFSAGHQVQYRCDNGRGGYDTLSEEVSGRNAFGHHVGVITDITELATAQHDLHAAETLSKHTVEQAPIGIAFVSRNGEVIKANRNFYHWTGVDDSGRERLNIRDLLRGEDADRIAAIHARLWSGEDEVVDFEVQFANATGRELWGRVTGALIRDAQGEVICGVKFVRDITVRKALEAAVSRSQQLVEAVIADLPIAIRACSADGRTFLCNREAERLFAIERSTDSNAADQLVVAAGLALLRADGNAELSAAEWPLACAIRGEQVHGMELIVRYPQGNQCTVITSAREILDTNGVRIGAVVATQDISQRRVLERDLAQAQKLESIGQLAAGIAHEINTPTQFIGDNVRFLDESARTIMAFLGELGAQVAQAGSEPLDAGRIAAALAHADVAYLQEEMPRAIAQTLEGVARIAKIVGAMKEFSHPSLERAALDVNHAIASTVTVATNEWKYVADVSTDFDDSLPPVPVVPGAFNQVILNLIVNAAHAIAAAAALEPARGKGTITLTTRRCGESVEILVADTGCGMPAHIIPRIFDPFFTTKPIGKGTGQGLAIAYDVVVNKHGGTIGVESEAGVGTTFRIRLPLREPAMAGAVAA